MNNIPFAQEQRVGDTLQRFDFYIEKIKTAIEYNGKQHYKDIDFFTTTLEQQQERDAKKEKYCIENNIDLVIIPYFYSDEQIETAIKKIINKFNDYSNLEVEANASK